MDNNKNNDIEKEREELILFAKEKNPDFDYEQFNKYLNIFENNKEQEFIISEQGTYNAYKE